MRQYVNLEVTGSVQQQVAWLQIAMQYVSRVYVLEAAQYLVEEVADVVVTELLCLEQLIHVCLHQTLHNVSKHNKQHFIITIAQVQV